jgi:hypothetical protein
MAFLSSGSAAVVWIWRLGRCLLPGLFRVADVPQLVVKRGRWAEARDWCDSIVMGWSKLHRFWLLFSFFFKCCYLQDFFFLPFLL